jgi:hypothetical protein
MAFVDSLHKSVVQHEVDPPVPKRLADVAVHDAWHPFVIVVIVVIKALTVAVVDLNIKILYNLYFNQIIIHLHSMIQYN